MQGPSLPPDLQPQSTSKSPSWSVDFYCFRSSLILASGKAVETFAAYIKLFETFLTVLTSKMEFLNHYCCAL